MSIAVPANTWDDVSVLCSLFSASLIMSTPLSSALTRATDTVKDCGNSAFHLENASGSFNSFAHYNPYNNAGSGCANSQGRYHVDQEWSFY